MSDEPLLTLKQVAEQLDLPESTARYYRDAFPDHIPSIGTGRILTGRIALSKPALAVLLSTRKFLFCGSSATGCVRRRETRKALVPAVSD